MKTEVTTSLTKRRAVNLSIRADILAEAKTLNINASQAAEAGIAAALREARTQKWLAANKSALEAHNARIAAKGVLLTPSWVRD